MSRRFPFVASCLLIFAAAETLAADLESGTVEGKVVIQAADLPRWRLSRFYVRKKGDMAVAEAVVALRGMQLKGLKPPTKPIEAVIDQRDFQFSPETTAVRIGTSVKFLNNDGGTHNVRAAHPVADFNENLLSGGEFIYLFKKPTGIQTPVTLGCVYHGNMRAFIYVFDHPFFSVTETAGTFRFEGVPVGELQLDVAHAAGQMKKSQSISVRKGETVKVEVQLLLPATEK